MADQRVEPVGFLLNAIERGFGIVARARQFDGDAKAGERRTEFVGNIEQQAAQRLAKEEGMLVGISAGATVAAALKAAETAPKGSVLLAMLPDTAERYLSTILFENVIEGSDDEWLASLDGDRIARMEDGRIVRLENLCS